MNTLVANTKSKLVVVVREAELVGALRAARVVAGVEEVGDLEAEVASGAVAPRAPADAVAVDVEAVVGAGGAQVARQRPRHPADAAADVEHVLVGLQAAELDEVRQELVAGRREVAVADEVQPPRRHEPVAPARDAVAQVERAEPRDVRARSMTGLRTAADHTIRAHMSEHRLPERDRPWMMRTYAGHSTAKASNALYRSNLAKGQTGLSVAFDLPTQTGYDPDHELARGEVGKVGVPVAHKGDMHTLMDGIPLDEMNTSMTINATAAWLLALYIGTAEENGVEESALQGTTQNDIIKEFLARGTYAFPPGPSMRLIADMVAYTVERRPEVEPDQHLQLPPAGGRRDARAGDRLRDGQRDRGARRGAASAWRRS